MEHSAELDVLASVQSAEFVSLIASEVGMLHMHPAIEHGINTSPKLELNPSQSCRILYFLCSSVECIFFFPRKRSR